MNINDLPFPQAQDGDRVLHEGIYYVRVNGEWVQEEINN